MLYFLIPLIAFLYASAGFGGASGYLVAMNFFGVPTANLESLCL